MDDLIIWTIYDHPTDYPSYFVARKDSLNHGQTQERLFSTTLDGIRQAVQNASPHLLYCLPRHEEDDPVILETSL